MFRTVTPVYETTLSGVVEQKNLRKRVASVTYEKLLDTQIEEFDHATHYSYDIHGNVNVLVQDFPEMELGLGASGFRFKSMYYKYDLISGNVLQVSYQPGKADQFYHRYEYDADNRITDVYTANMGWASGQDVLTNIDMPWELPYWEKDATYGYYLHGPLGREEVEELCGKIKGFRYALRIIVE